MSSIPNSKWIQLKNANEFICRRQARDYQDMGKRRRKVDLNLWWSHMKTQLFCSNFLITFKNKSRRLQIKAWMLPVRDISNWGRWEKGKIKMEGNNPNLYELLPKKAWHFWNTSIITANQGCRASNTLNSV